MAAATATVPDAAIGVRRRRGSPCRRSTPPCRRSRTSTSASSRSATTSIPRRRSPARWEGGARRPGRALDEPHALQPGPGREGVELPDPAVRHRAERGERAQAKPVAGWPVVIFQHGLHGQSRAVRRRSPAPMRRRDSSSRPSTSRCTASRTRRARCYQAARRAHVRPRPRGQCDRRRRAPTASIDPSGTYIINLTSLLTSRDNLRQAALDIVQLVERAADPRPRRRHGRRTSTARASISPASRSAASSERSRTRCRSRRCPPT